MGGCCSSSRGAELARSPVYFYCPQELGNESLSSTRGTSSAVSAGLLVDTNLETSIPDTYLAPPAPLPYDVDSQPMVEAEGRFQSSDISGVLEKSDCKVKTDFTLDSSKLTEDEPMKLDESVASDLDEEDVCPTCLEVVWILPMGILVASVHGAHMYIYVYTGANNGTHYWDSLTVWFIKMLFNQLFNYDIVVPSSLVNPCHFSIEVAIRRNSFIMLEYDVENPRIITKCEHHFHLSCILEWMERSDSCPICDQMMVIDHASDG